MQGSRLEDLGVWRAWDLKVCLEAGCRGFLGPKMVALIALKST